MDPEEAPERLVEMLTERGIIPNREPKPREMWEIFREFANEPVECDDVYLYVLVGDSGYTGYSYLDFSRGFRTKAEDGSDVELQVHARFEVKLPSRLGFLQIEIVSTDFESLRDFFTEVERREEFVMALDFPDWQFSIYHH